MKRLIQIIIGILFLVSGGFKIIDSASFAKLIVSYGFPNLQVVAPFIAGFEIILGLCFILSIEIKKVSFLIMITTLIFTIAYAYAYFFKGIEDCGCMGKTIKIPPIVSFIRNVLVIVATYWLWRIGDKHEDIIKPWKRWIIYGITGISLCMAGSTFSEPIFIKKESHVKESFNPVLFLKYFDGIIPKNGIKLIYLFSPNCEHCWNATENIKSMKDIPELSNVTGITFNDEDLSYYANELKPNFQIVPVPHNELTNIITETPILVVLENGHLRYHFVAGDIPCGVMLQKLLAKDKK